MFYGCPKRLLEGVGGAFMITRVLRWTAEVVFNVTMHKMQRIDVSAPVYDLGREEERQPLTGFARFTFRKVCSNQPFVTSQISVTFPQNRRQNAGKLREKREQ